MTNVSYPFVSVIIPVYNNSEKLRKCLTALENQTYPKELFEVVVVDNCSTENIKDVVSNFSRIYLTYEPYSTLYAARNKGIVSSKGEVLAFTDSDCIPAPDWMEKGVNAIMSVPDCGLIAGRIEIYFKNPKRPTAAELFEKVTMRQDVYVKRWRFGATANVFTLRNVVNKVGLFDGSLKSGGDVEWSRRVVSAGYKIVYDDNVCILHPARYSLSEIYKKQTMIIGGFYDMDSKKGYPLMLFISHLVGTWNWMQPSYFISVCFGKDLSGCMQRVKVVMVMLFVKCVQTMERIRLRLGGKSQRGI
ncbi:MAG: glycosyltransferase [Candidatus Omnitrophica bacterium]|nr:glycosyltransferase [Candidatus Omnitrophota bacterium]